MVSKMVGKLRKSYRKALLAAFVAASIVSGCSNGIEVQGDDTNLIPVIEETEDVTYREVLALSPAGMMVKTPQDLTVQEPIEAPIFLRAGEEHPKVAQLQARLMELGFMENDEPTNYFGNVTDAAIKTFQRQNNLAMDGLVGSETWNAIMSSSAKYYAASKGHEGDDIKRIQLRLYELGYLATQDQVNGSFSDTTEAAVVKLQGVNGIAADGKVGIQTLNLLYSDEIKPNLLAYGEKSDVVLASQNRLKELGYLTTTPDGAYGNDTAVAIKQFQARNDLVVDGFLGPSTRSVLNSSGAQANGLVLGERGESVQRVQELLSKYGYLSSSNATGYYGEMTEQAVRSFQSNNGLSVDGSVGKQTMNKLTASNVRRAGSSNSSNSSNSSGSSGGSKAPSGGGAVSVEAGASIDRLLSVARSKVGSPYVWGSKGPNSFDCSGFIYWSLNQAGIKQSYLTSSGWRNVGKYTKITNFSDLRAGDIVVVKGHMGIASGGGQVVDASSSHGRVVERALNSWWKSNFICGWRIF